MNVSNDWLVTCNFEKFYVQVKVQNYVEGFKWADQPRTVELQFGTNLYLDSLVWREKSIGNYLINQVM